MFPRPSELYNRVVARPSAKDVSFAHGDPIWFREIFNGAGPSTLRPGLFDRYGAVRVRIVLVDDRGVADRDGLDRPGWLYVSPLNVYARLDRDEVDASAEVRP